VGKPQFVQWDFPFFKVGIFIDILVHNIYINIHYYIRDIQTWLISYGKLFSQGWEPHLGCNGLRLCHWKGDLIAKESMSNNVFKVTLQVTYPNVGQSARKEKGSDDMLLRCLRFNCKNTVIVFSTREQQEPVSLFNWHWRMGHRSMRAIKGM